MPSTPCDTLVNETILYVVDIHHIELVDTFTMILYTQAVRNEVDLNCMAVPVKYRKMNTFYKVSNIMDIIEYKIYSHCIYLHIEWSPQFMDFKAMGINIVFGY